MEVVNEVEIAQAWLATAENSVQRAKLESRAAKRRRKETKEAARRAKKRLRRAEEELAEAARPSRRQRKNTHARRIVKFLAKARRHTRD